MVGGRIVKKIENSRDWDCTYVYYYDGQKPIETHNGSEHVIKQHLWGLQYIDELVQIAAGDDPADAGEDDCESVYYACHNANFNVLGVVDDSGDLIERYEYTPYGERVVFVNSGTGDADTSAPALESARVATAGSVTQPWGLCEVGHQGLIHDKETALIYNRARMLSARFGRFMQRDPLGYVDGMNVYEDRSSTPCGAVDPYGLMKDPVVDGCVDSVGKGVFRFEAEPGEKTVKVCVDGNVVATQKISKETWPPSFDFNWLKMHQGAKGRIELITENH